MSKPQEKVDVEVPRFVHEAQAAKFLAEAREHEALAALHRANAQQAEHEAIVSGFAKDREQHKRNLELASDEHNRVYRFTGGVDQGTAAKCMDTLNRWSRIDGDDPQPIEIVFFSPGGSVVDGMALFDTIQLLRHHGHRVTTTAIGMAASMGSILLQAGDVRRMTRESWVLIHQISAGAQGSMGEIEDRVEWFKKMEQRVLDIFADRAKASKAKKALTRKQFEAGYNRKDWWIDSADCLRYGIVDEVL